MCVRMKLDGKEVAQEGEVDGAAVKAAEKRASELMDSVMLAIMQPQRARRVEQLIAVSAR